MSTVSYQFEPGPRYRVTDIKGVKQIKVEFTEIGADCKLIKGRVKEKVSEDVIVEGERAREKREERKSKK